MRWSLAPDARCVNWWLVSIVSYGRTQELVEVGGCGCYQDVRTLDRRNAPSGSAAHQVSNGGLLDRTDSESSPCAGYRSAAITAAISSSATSSCGILR